MLLLGELALFYLGESGADRSGNCKLHLNPAPILYNLETDNSKQDGVPRRFRLRLLLKEDLE